MTVPIDEGGHMSTQTVSGLCTIAMASTICDMPYISWELGIFPAIPLDVERESLVHSGHGAGPTGPTTEGRDWISFSGCQRSYLGSWHLALGVLHPIRHHITQHHTDQALGTVAQCHQ